MKYMLKDPVRSIPGVGEAMEAALHGMGIATLQELLQWYPRLYIDASHPSSISDVPFGVLSTIEVTVLNTVVHRTKNRGMVILDALCTDGQEQMRAKWFHQPYLKDKLVAGSRWLLIGTFQRFKGEVQVVNPILEQEARILPVYAQGKGVTSKALRGFTRWALDHVDVDQESPLPEEIRLQEGLTTYSGALHALHVPSSVEETEKGRLFVSFIEVFNFFSGLERAGQELKSEEGIRVEYDLRLLQEVIASLPYTLTAGQKRVIWDSLQDMASGRPMTRLLNGDVGSGKTVVAAILAAVLAKAGWRTILMAPTEILAEQHYQTITSLLQSHGVSVGMWTANRKDKDLLYDITVGTHAVLRESLAVDRLGLVVIDEQHRFGVEQRSLLRERATVIPHILSMTATPIPRTLALVLYGNLQVSLLTEKPALRKPIETQIIKSYNKGLLHSRILEELRNNHQVFVICPLIEKKEELDPERGISLLGPAEISLQEQKSVLAEAERLRTQHPEYGEVVALHGKLRAKEKAEIMQRMAEGKINVLVATSVIEVGVDVPNATVMVIEGAERFGLAQLHQFRGRVGRGESQSYCFLYPTVANAKNEQRLQVLVDSDNGFVIAEADLEQRGFGELTGLIQSGAPEFRMASMSNIAFLEHVKQVVHEYMEKHPEFLRQELSSAYSKKLAGLE